MRNFLETNVLGSQIWVLSWKQRFWGGQIWEAIMNFLQQPVSPVFQILVSLTWIKTISLQGAKCRGKKHGNSEDDQWVNT